MASQPFILVVMRPLPCFPTVLASAFIGALAGVLPLPAQQPAVAAATNSTPPSYEFRQIHSRDGIGKFYFGREIAHVIGGHQATEWLERPEREAEENTSRLIPLLKIKEGDTVADIGCGTGYITRRLARAAGPRGRVYGVDIQAEMLTVLTNSLAKEGIHNVVPVLGTIRDPRLATNSIDLAILVDVYHELDHPYEMMTGLVRALKPQGRIVFVEFRAEDPKVPIKELHKMSQAQVRKEMSVHPLKWVETLNDLPWQHVIVFQKK